MPIVVEIQNDGTNVAQANQQYHTVLSFAAVSQVAHHAAVMLTDRGTS